MREEKVQGALSERHTVYLDENHIENNPPKNNILVEPVGTSRHHVHSQSTVQYYHPVRPSYTDAVPVTPASTGNQHASISRSRPLPRHASPPKTYSISCFPSHSGPSTRPFLPSSAFPSGHLPLHHRSRLVIKYSTTVHLYTPPILMRFPSRVTSQWISPFVFFFSFLFLFGTVASIGDSAITASHRASTSPAWHKVPLKSLFGRKSNDWRCNCRAHRLVLRLS